jgi:hypothetical protein
MGTSIGYSLPTSGNWPDVKRETTSLGTTGVADAGNVGKLMSHYVQAHGGSGRAAQQMSAASRAGAKLAGFLVGVQRDGLTQTLVNVGLGELVGQPVPSVLRGLTDYLAGPGSLLEEDIVRWALFDYQDEIFGACDSYEELDAALSRLVEGEGIGAVLKRFFGFCIYRRFRTHLVEHLMKAANSVRTARRLLRDIKEFIFSKLDVRTHGRDPMHVNWRGSEGESLSQEILGSVWRVFGEG